MKRITKVRQLKAHLVFGAVGDVIADGVSHVDTLNIPELDPQVPALDSDLGAAGDGTRYRSDTLDGGGWTRPLALGRWGTVSTW